MMAKFVSNNSSSALCGSMLSDSNRDLKWKCQPRYAGHDGSPCMHRNKRVVIGSNFALNYTMCNPIEISRTAQGVM